MSDLGDVVPLTIDIRDVNGSLANAGAVTLTVLRPDGTAALPTVTNPTVGRYQVDYLPLLAGRYVAVWTATGANASSLVQRFEVTGAPLLATWPPLLEDLKADLAVTADDAVTEGDDDRLQSVLDSAVAVVERELEGTYNFTGLLGDPLLPPPPRNVLLGTVRLAGRWHVRRTSPEGLVQLGDLGSARVPSTDVDIDRLLGLGRFRPPTVA